MVTGRTAREVDALERMMWAEVDGELDGAKRSLDHMVQNMGMVGSVRSLLSLGVFALVGIFLAMSKNGWMVGVPMVVLVLVAAIVPRMCIDLLVRNRKRVLTWCTIAQVLGLVSLLIVGRVVSQTSMGTAMAIVGVGMATVIVPVGIKVWVFADSRVISTRYAKAQAKRIVRAAKEEFREGAGALGVVAAPTGPHPPIAPRDAMPAKPRKKPIEDADDNIYRNLR